MTNVPNTAVWRELEKILLALEVMEVLGSDNINEIIKFGTESNIFD